MLLSRVSCRKMSTQRNFFGQMYHSPIHKNCKSLSMCDISTHPTPNPHLTSDVQTLLQPFWSF
uniref:Uncharacterized protein n=1 Tax=Anguilla anguilla TaxID=7936 RepID=A0A0E9WFP0_ANGAN